MSNEYQAPTNKKNKFKVVSHIAKAEWQCTAAVANNEAPVYVKTALVGDGAQIEIKGYSSSGKDPGTIKGQVFNNCFYGKLPIPEKIEVDADVWFEAKLPKHGISSESDSVPARPAIFVNSMKWDKTIVHQEEELKMTIDFESGVDDGTIGTIVVYEYSPEGHHEKVLTARQTIENMKLEVEWIFNYNGKINEIPTEVEMSRFNKHYVNPKYFFVLIIYGIIIGDAQESGFVEFKGRLNLPIFDAYGVPMKNEKFKIRFSDNTKKNYTADENGIITDESIPPGKLFVDHVKKQ